VSGGIGRPGTWSWTASLRWLGRYPARRWRALSVVIAAMLGQTILVLLAPWPMKLIVDHVLYGLAVPPPLDVIGSVDGLLIIGVAGTVLVFGATWAASLGNELARIAFGRRMVYDLGADLFAHLHRLSPRYHARRSVGDTMRRVTTDTGAVSSIIQDAMLPALMAAIGLVSVALVMWQLQPAMALLSLAVIAPMIVAFKRFAAPMAEQGYAQQQAEGELYEVVERQLSAMPVVQAFAAEEAGDVRFSGVTDRALRATIAVTAVQFQFKALIGLATALGTAGILWLGASEVLAGRSTVGTMLVFIAYLAVLYGHVEALMYAPATAQQARGSLRRVREILDAQPEVADLPGAVELARVDGAVVLEDVVFGYEPERPVLRGVSLEARPGETIALVGATGAGKSTLVGLVPRFFDPWSGRVLIDGRDVRSFRLASLRRAVAVVLQEPFLFPLSIADNIAYGRPGASAEQVEAAARTANAHEFISRLPEGYATVIGERGATLSGGERQRIAIARALLKDAPILILDEPTSALDAQTESLLLEALERLMAGRTTFIIAHRLSTIRRAQRIVVLDQGRVVEQGRHRELIAAGGHYARLHDLQAWADERPPAGMPAQLEAAAS